MFSSRFCVNIACLEPFLRQILPLIFDDEIHSKNKKFCVTQSNRRVILLDTFVFHCIYYNTTNSELSNKTVILCSNKNRVYHSKSFTLTFTMTLLPVLSFNSTIGRPTTPSIFAVPMVDFGCVFTKSTAS